MPNYKQSSINLISYWPSFKATIIRLYQFIQKQRCSNPYHIITTEHHNHANPSYPKIPNPLNGLTSTTQQSTSTPPNIISCHNLNPKNTRKLQSKLKIAVDLLQCTFKLKTFNRSKNTWQLKNWTIQAWKILLTLIIFKNKKKLFLTNSRSFETPFGLNNMSLKHFTSFWQINS